MANKQSALKELRKTKKRTAQNLLMKTHVKHLFRECMDLIKAGDMLQAKDKAVLFQQAADKAAKRHVISLNRARRKKASISAFLNNKRSTTKISREQSAPATEPETKAPAESTPTES